MNDATQSARSDLLKKYDIPGPRYTSYPTVPYWDSTPTEQQWFDAVASAMAKVGAMGKGGAIYLHIPFCQQLCTYCGCNTRITRNRSVVGPYLDALLKEWKMLRDGLRLRGINNFNLTELHLGGGTPTYLTAAELEHLLAPLLESVDISDSHEFSIEADPRVTTGEHLETLARLGFRRLSLGIQDFDPRVQETVNRVQSVQQVQQVTEQARRVGFTGINFDLIYGLPFQTEASVAGTMASVLKLRPDRIAYYAYAHVPWIKPGQRKFTEEDLPVGAQKRRLYELGRQYLEEAGYVEIGMDHFALKTDPLFRATQSKTLYRNFMGYTAREVSPLIGLGVSAIGDAWTAFVQNEKSLENYLRRLEMGQLPILRGHLLNAEDLRVRRRILDLMTHFESNIPHSQAEDSTEFSVNLVNQLREDGLIELEDSKIQVTPAGLPFLRNICMAFDARMLRNAPEAKLFSKTI